VIRWVGFRRSARRRGRPRITSRAALWVLLGASCLASGCASSPPPALESLVYRIEAGRNRIEVQIESRGDKPERWILLGQGPRLEGERDGGQGLRPRGLEVQSLDDQGQEKTNARVAKGFLDLPARRLRYTYSLKGHLRADPDLEHGAGSPGSYLLRGDRYLLVPPDALLPDGVAIELRFRGLEPFLPWPAERQGQEWVVHLRPSDLRQLGFHAFGARRRFQLDLPQAKWEVAVLEGELLATDEVLKTWIQRAASDAVAMAAGAPRERVAIVLAPVSSADPAPFGRVLYSDPRSAAIYVGQRAPARSFAGDWLATHELMHTLHPRFSGQARFLSEGIASYYQCLAPIRVGREEPATLWGTLARGVTRGRAEAHGRSLREVTRVMHRLQAYGAVYWGGALLALELDLELRRATEGKVGLEQVLADLRSERQVSLRALGAAIDARAGVPIWAAVRDAHLNGQALERGRPLLRSLGIGPDGLDPEATGSVWRKRLELGS